MFIFIHTSPAGKKFTQLLADTIIATLATTILFSSSGSKLHGHWSAYACMAYFNSNTFHRYTAYSNPTFLGFRATSMKTHSNPFLKSKANTPLLLGLIFFHFWLVFLYCLQRTKMSTACCYCLLFTYVCKYTFSLNNRIASCLLQRFFALF